MITKLAAKFNEFNWGIPNGFTLSSTIKSNEFNIKIKNPLFCDEIDGPPTFTREIIKIVVIFLQRKTKSLTINLKKLYNLKYQ